MEDQGTKPGWVSQVIRAAYVTRLFVWQSNTSVEAFIRLLIGFATHLQHTVATNERVDSWLVLRHLCK